MVETTGKTPMIEINNLKKHFKVGRKQMLKAVDGITFTINRGETFGLVGESGCGKSTVGRTIIRLYDTTDGEVYFNGEQVHSKKSGKELKSFNQNMQMVFQDPYASLNPRMTVKDIIAEGIDKHGLNKRTKECIERINDHIEKVGINHDNDNSYLHVFSGGQRKRIGIARALAVDPEFIIADETISALDVFMQAQVVNFMQKLQEEHGLTYLFIAHDLSMVKHISDRVGVMYLGNMAELAPAEKLYENPLHPYTKALLSSVPVPDPKIERERERIIIEGDIPSPVSPPSGCPFRTRCPMAMDICSEVKPRWLEVESDHWVACHLHYDESDYQDA